MSPFRSYGSWVVRAGTEGLHEQWPRDTQGKPKNKEGLSGSSPLRPDGSSGSQAGKLDPMRGGQKCSRKS
jgi:hypothetical protein